MQTTDLQNDFWAKLSTVAIVRGDKIVVSSWDGSNVYYDGNLRGYGIFLKAAKEEFAKNNVKSHIAKFAECEGCGRIPEKCICDGEVWDSDDVDRWGEA